MGQEITLKYDNDRIAGGSSGFYAGYGDMWRFAKWDNGVMQSHPRFRKIHMGVSLPSTVIVTVCTSEGINHDNPHFSHLWRQTSPPIMKLVSRRYLDKAYWDENITGLISQECMCPFTVTPHPISNQAINQLKPNLSRDQTKLTEF